jgi:hypothetical protein
MHNRCRQSFPKRTVIALLGCLTANPSLRAASLASLIEASLPSAFGEPVTLEQTAAGGCGARQACNGFAPSQLADAGCVYVQAWTPNAVICSRCDRKERNADVPLGTGHRRA